MFSMVFLFSSEVLIVMFMLSSEKSRFFVCFPVYSRGKYSCSSVNNCFPVKCWRICSCSPVKCWLTCSCSPVKCWLTCSCPPVSYPAEPACCRWCPQPDGCWEARSLSPGGSSLDSIDRQTNVINKRINLQQAGSVGSVELIILVLDFLSHF